MSPVTSSLCDHVSAPDLHAIADRIEPCLGTREYDSGNWRERAACRGINPDLFFPAGERDELSAEDTLRAKAVCASCSVQDECLIYAISNHVDHGVFGGFTEQERVRVKRRLKYVRHCRHREAVSA